MSVASCSSSRAGIHVLAVTSKVHSKLEVQLCGTTKRLNSRKQADPARFAELVGYKQIGSTPPLLTLICTLNT